MRKIVSLILVVLLLFSMVPTVYAAVGSCETCGDAAAICDDCGRCVACNLCDCVVANDYSQGTKVIFEAANAESYTITVPAKLKPGQSGTVTLQGTWPSNKTISVTAESTVTLINSILVTDQKILGVSFLGIEQAGNDMTAKTYTESVSVASIENALFGTWSGTFSYNVDTTQNTEVNQSGVYFNQPYVATMDGTPVEYVLYKDGSVSMWIADAMMEYSEPGTLTYYEDKIVSKEGADDETTILVSEDGTTLTDASDETIVFTLNLLTQKPLQTGMFDADPNGLLNLGIEMSAEVESDGSATMYQDGISGGTISADNITYYDHYFVVDGAAMGAAEDVVCYTHPSGNKFSYDGIIFVNTDSYAGIQYGGFYSIDITENDETRTYSYVFYENGDVEVYVDYELVQKMSEVATYTITSVTIDEIKMNISHDGCAISANGLVLILENPCNHEYTTTQSAAPTCTTKGYVNGVVCVDCKRVLSADEMIAAVGHSYDDGTITTPVSCVKNGIKTYTCVTCRKTYTETITATGHTYADGGYICTVCGYENVISYALTASDYQAKTGIDISAGNIVIPEVFQATNGKWYKVTSIGDYAFKDCASLTGVSIPNSVTEIGGQSFANCIGLTSMDIPESVTIIDANAFYCCTNLKSINVPDSVTTIRTGAFYYCTSLTAINIPEGVQSIESRVFQNCTNLTNVDIPDSVLKIGNGAFMHCTSFTNIVIPDNVTILDEYAFDGCTNLANIKLGKSVESIEYMAFLDCASLTSINIPDSVTSIGNCVFWGCSNLTNVNMGKGVINIGHSVFEGCEKLSSVNIPDGVTTLRETLFYCCPRLTSITIPSSVTNIETRAFESCIALTSISYTGTTDDWGNITFGENWANGVPATVVICSNGVVPLP